MEEGPEISLVQWIKKKGPIVQAHFASIIKWWLSKKLCLGCQLQMKLSKSLCLKVVHSDVNMALPGKAAAFYGF